MTVAKATLLHRAEMRRLAVPLEANDVIHGDIEYFHGNFDPTTDGICRVWRRNGRIQLWKTRPTEFRQPVKHGIYTYGQITHRNVENFHDGARCPLSNDL